MSSHDIDPCIANAITGRRHRARQPKEDFIDGGGMSTLLSDADEHAYALLIGAGVPYDEGRNAYLADHGFGGSSPDPDERETLDGIEDASHLKLVS